MPKIHIRSFDGDSSAYKEWRREIDATQFLYEVPESQLAGLVYLALAPGEGKPRDLFSHMDVREQLCSEDGLKEIWKTLDAEYVRDMYTKVDEAQARYDRCRRAPGQQMGDYLMESRLSRRILEKEDKGTTISEVAYARRLLRKAA